MLQTILINKQVDVLGEALQKKFFSFLDEYKLRQNAEDYFAIDFDEVKREEEYFYPYRLQAEKIKIWDRRTMFVNVAHFMEYDENYEFRNLVLTEYSRFEGYINKALEDFMKKYYFDWAKKKGFYVAFYNTPENNKIRELRTSKIGRLINISGTITRTSEVRPELVTGSFICRMCRAVVRNVDQQFRFTEPRMCANNNCNNRTKWDLNTEESIFADWQKLRIQENPSDIPPGSMPRSMDVVIRNDIVELCKPGDKCLFSGVLLVVPDIISMLKPGEKVQHELKRETVRKEEQKPQDGVSGLKTLGLRDMTYKMIFLAHYVQSADIKINPYTQVKIDSREKKEVKLTLEEEFNDSELNAVLNLKNQPGIYAKLAKSIAPSVYGHEEVKKGILLMLFGGLNKITNEGIKLRGDINVCIVGDPSTAKSQFLKYVCQLLPRSVYTSGKGSTAAGLTASVIRDAESGEFCIEAGALMLADNGICCIDEFDKMDSNDQVAIHEAMEQQTISIAKAGIQATLMARTSVLAAANPVYGRYDKTKSLRTNINISAPIMSRFDLFYVIVDERNDYSDYQIAQHIVNLHRVYGMINSGQNDTEADQKLRDHYTSEISQEELKLYLRFAKHVTPKFTKEAALKLREEYQNLRQNDISVQKSAYRMTVRQLESLIRLSEALAKVHLEELIHTSHVSEAARLLKKSIINVEMPSVELEMDFERNLNEDRKKYKKEDQEDVVMMDAEGNGAENVEGKEEEENLNNREKKRVVMSGSDYEKLKNRIIMVLRDLDSKEIRVKHKDIIECICEEEFEHLESGEKTEEYIAKLNAIIERLIDREGIIIVTAENDDKSERVLSLNVNYDADIF